MKTLKLFNAVVAREGDDRAFVSEKGFIIQPNAYWAKDKITEFYEKERLSGNDLNKTFHKSWAKIKNSTRYELLIDQINHYVSTYGSDFRDEVYIPDEVLDIDGLKLKFIVVNAYFVNEMKDKCLSLLRSGIALKEETINDVITILVDELDYTFTGSEGIRNKEAIIKIADMYGILPSDTMEFFRYIIYRATGESLLIKNHNMINKIKTSNYNPSAQFKNFGVEKLATIFNRFKPLFLAFKSKCPATINKISKLSKKYHTALVSNPLNEVTSRTLTDDDLHWLDNATPFALFRALSICWNRMGNQDTFLYRIRNGKSFVKEGNQVNTAVPRDNYRFIMTYLRDKLDMDGSKVFLPKDIEYAIPTSEKMFVGNIPTGTRFYGEKLAVGIYWENNWGANDLDLSGLNIGGKVGWNSSYNQDGGSLMYSGDITNAPNGAVEYLYAQSGLKDPTLVLNNVYSGNHNSGFKIIVGRGDNINNNYMMNPENLFMEVMTESVEKQSILGIFMPVDSTTQSFVLLNFGMGNSHVSGGGKMSELSTKALFQQWNNSLTLRDLLKDLNAEIVLDPEDDDFDFSLDKLEKDSFIEIFEKKEKEVLV
jgi:hypothetical protein